MSKKISFDVFNTNEIRQAIQEVENYKAFVQKKTRELSDRLSLIGVQEASIRFTGAIYDGTNDVHLRTEETSDGENYIFTIYAEGQAVCFIEFGAGVYYNSAGYPLQKPAGVVGIGEYGKGKGKQNTWAYYGENPGSNGVLYQSAKGSVVITHGNPAAMPMYYAGSEMKQKILSIAKEVFER